MVGEYLRNDMEKQNGYTANQIIVYDCIDPSPFYDYEDPKDQYYDEKDAIELPDPQE